MINWIESGECREMNIKHILILVFVSVAFMSTVNAQSKYEAELCDAAKTGRTIELVYDQDAKRVVFPGLSMCIKLVLAIMANSICMVGSIVVAPKAEIMNPSGFSDLIRSNP